MNENPYFNVIPPSSHVRNERANVAHLQIGRNLNATALPGVRQLYAALLDDSLWRHIDSAPDTRTREKFVQLLGDFYTPAASLLTNGGIMVSTGHYAKTEIKTQDHYRFQGVPIGAKNERCKIEIVTEKNIPMSVFQMDDLPDDLQANIETKPVVEKRIAVLANRKDLDIGSLNKNTTLLVVAQNFARTLQTSDTVGESVIWNSYPLLGESDYSEGFVTLENALRKNYERLVTNAGLPMIVGYDATALGVLFADAARATN